MQPRHARTTRRKPRAKTSDVLGTPIQKERIKPKWRRYYERLIELRDQLARRQTALSQSAIEEQPAFSSHMADAGTDTYDRDLALSVLSAEQNAAYEIEEALNRIRDGSYGICELTGKPIEPERLEAIPWTRFSTEAEKQLEREGAVARAKLGSRETVENSTLASEAESEDEEEAE